MTIAINVMNNMVKLLADPNQSILGFSCNEYAQYTIPAAANTDIDTVLSE